MTTSDNAITLYQSSDGKTALDVHLDHDTVWLSQAQLVSLFDRNQSVISRHLRNVFNEGELDGNSNMQKKHIAISDKPLVLYSLDVIISIGYRVKSQQGTQFRIWATKTLKDHIVKGYSINEQRFREQAEKRRQQKNSCSPVHLLSWR